MSDSRLVLGRMVPVKKIEHAPGFDLRIKKRPSGGRKEVYNLENKKY